MATTPLGIVLELKPDKEQVYEPFAPKQDKDFAALVALAPAATVIPEKSAVEYVNFHSKPAGLVPLDVRDTLSATLPPTGAVPDASDKDTCANNRDEEARIKEGRSVSLLSQEWRKSIGVSTFTDLYA